MNFPMTCYSDPFSVVARRVLCTISCFVLMACFHSLRAESVLNTVHNLSVNGPGSIKATSETDACIFCHTVHKSNGATPLWNHNSLATNYVVYSSPTLDAIGLVVPQPNGSSRLCLSCHDGTVALGSVSSQTISISMQQSGGTPVTTMPAGPSNLGIDLSGDHPISFVYDATLASKDSQIKDPSTLTGKVKLDAQNRLQCTACHDPHNNQFGQFLVMDNTGSSLCLACHNVANWTGSAHAMAAPTPTTFTKNPQITPQKLSTSGKQLSFAKAPSSPPPIPGNGCASCHVSHAAGGKQQLMRYQAPEKNCLPCHNGSISSTKNIAIEFQKASAHPILQDPTAHRLNEDPVNPSVRHVTCADCHNPHSAKPSHQQQKTSDALMGIAGLSSTGARLASATKPYELCFRCHADSAKRGPATIRRQVVETNTRLQFAASNRSFHPIETPGKGGLVPSLLAPWTISSTVDCTDCHNSDKSPSAGGNGADGPHGSIYAPLLERRLVTTDHNPETPANYALCYKCHSRDSILSDRSFRAVNSLGQDRGHRFHIADTKASCATCHDSHGVANNPRLINFNLDYVSPGSNGRLKYVSTGPGSGNCSLTCHGKDHSATPFPAPAFPLLRARR